MSFFSVGRRVALGYCVIIIPNVVILALSYRVNRFQDYFYFADIFPLTLSAVTLSITVLAFVLDVALDNSPTARPPFQIAMLIIFSVLWLAFNALSSSRWRHLPLNCSVIPSDYPDVRTWCRDLNALKGIVWLNWVVLFLLTLVTLRFSVMQHQNGQKHIWRMPLSRFVTRGSHRNSGTNKSVTSQIDDFLRFSR